MKCPCIKCIWKGCGAYHDYCYKYRVWRNVRQVAATRRNAQQEADKLSIARSMKLQKGVRR